MAPLNALDQADRSERQLQRHGIDRAAVGRAVPPRTLERDAGLAGQRQPDRGESATGWNRLRASDSRTAPETATPRPRPNPPETPWSRPPNGAWKKAVERGDVQPSAARTGSGETPRRPWSPRRLPAGAAATGSGRDRRPPSARSPRRRGARKETPTASTAGRRSTTAVRRAPARAGPNTGRRPRRATCRRARRARRVRFAAAAPSGRPSRRR